MLQLLDTHQHLVYRDQAGYSWTQGIPVLAKRDFTLADYARLTEGLGIGGTLFMETAVDDPKSQGDSNYQDEFHFVHGLAADQASGIKGLISSIRPEKDFGFDAWLEKSYEMGVVGYRRILHVVDDDMSRSDTFRNNVRRIGNCRKVFEMCFMSWQLPIALELAKSCDNTSLVLNHCGVPDIAGGGIDGWKKDISALAALPHVACKLSGIMAYCAPGEASLAAIRPYVDHVLEVFGPARMVWGSDWPVVDMAKGLPEWIAVTRQILEGLSEDEARQLASGTPEKIYGVRMA